MLRLMRVSLGLLMLWATQLAASTQDFALADLDGRVHRLSDYRGKWVVVNYWATWCPPCLEELPELEVFHNNHKDKDAVVLGVNFEKIASDTLRKFIEDQFISFPILKGEPGDPLPLGKVPAMPTSYLVSPKGEVIARQVGTLTRAELEKFIQFYGERQ